MRKLTILFLALTLSAGLWADNPPMPPTGDITYGELYFKLINNDEVELVCKIDDKPVPYSGDVVVPEGFVFKDTQQRQYILRVTGIGVNAFNSCPGLTSVILPASIESIGDNAFANSENLISVTCLGTTPATLGTEVFTGDNKLSIYVPIWTKETYQTAWNAYEDLIQLTDFDQTKEDALVQIQTAREGIKNTEVNNWIDAAIHDIQSGNQNATPSIDEIKDQILYIINLFQNGKTEGLEEGKAAGKAEVLGEMGAECNDCPAVKLTKNGQAVILYAPEKVKIIKIPANK